MDATGVICCCAEPKTCPPVKIDYDDGTHGILPHNGTEPPWYGGNDVEFPYELVLRMDAGGEILYTKEVENNGTQPFFQVSAQYMTNHLDGGVILVAGGFQIVAMIENRENSGQWLTLTYNDSDKEVFKEIKLTLAVNRVSVGISAHRECRQLSYIGASAAGKFLSEIVEADITIDPEDFPTTIQGGAIAPSIPPAEPDEASIVDGLIDCCPFENPPECYYRQITMDGGYRFTSGTINCAPMEDVYMERSFEDLPTSGGGNLLATTFMTGYDSTIGYYIGPAPFQGKPNYYIILYCDTSSNIVRAVGVKQINTGGVITWGEEGTFTWDNNKHPCQTGYTWLGAWSQPVSRTGEVCVSDSTGQFTVTFNHTMVPCPSPPRRWDNLEIRACAGKVKQPCSGTKIYPIGHGESCTQVFEDNLMPACYRTKHPGQYYPMVMVDIGDGNFLGYPQQSEVEPDRTFYFIQQGYSHGIDIETGCAFNAGGDCVPLTCFGIPGCEFRPWVSIPPGKPRPAVSRQLGWYWQSKPSEVYQNYQWCWFIFEMHFGRWADTGNRYVRVDFTPMRDTDMLGITRYQYEQPELFTFDQVFILDLISQQTFPPDSEANYTMQQRTPAPPTTLTLSPSRFFG